MMQQASSSNRAFPYAITVKPKGGEQAYRPTSEQHRYEKKRGETGSIRTAFRMCLKLCPT